MRSWIWGGIVLVGSFCQAGDGFWPNRDPSAQQRVLGGENLPPLLKPTSPVHVALQDGPSGSHTSAQENFRERAASESRPPRSDQEARTEQEAYTEQELRFDQEAAKPTGHSATSSFQKSDFLASGTTPQPASADRKPGSRAASSGLSAETGPNAVVAGPTQAGIGAEGESRSGSAPARSSPLRLGSPTQSRPLSGDSGRTFDPTASTLTVLSSLAVVLGVFLLVVWAIRRAMPRGTQPLPTEVVEVLGRAPLMGKQQMYLLRCGPKLLLVSVTPEGAKTLTEIDHPDEVVRITALCRQGQPGSISKSFRKVLDQMTHEKPVHGWFGRSRETAGEPAGQEKPVEEESAHV